MNPRSCCHINIGTWCDVQAQTCKKIRMLTDINIIKLVFCVATLHKFPWQKQISDWVSTLITSKIGSLSFNELWISEKFKNSVIRSRTRMLVLDVTLELLLVLLLLRMLSLVVVVVIVVAKTIDFDQQTASGAPVRWSKYTTIYLLLSIIAKFE